MNGHVRLEDMAAFLDRELSEEEAVRVETHLASCDECRFEVVEVSRTLYSPSNRKPWVVLGALAAAASIVGVLLLAPGTSELGSPETSAVRAAGSSLVEEGVHEI